jgi:hypothetical protein
VYSTARVHQKELQLVTSAEVGIDVESLDFDTSTRDIENDADARPQPWELS